MRTQRGITLVEALVVTVISAIILMGVASAYAAATTFQTKVQPSIERVEAQRKFELQLTELLNSATLDTDTSNLASFFVASSKGDNPLSSEESGQSMPDTLTITGLGTPASGAYRESLDEFEILNQKFSTQAGTTETSISLTAFGDAGGRTGLFLRTQRPADGDSTQGGMESVMNADVDQIGFEFFNGTEWTVAWDSEQSGARRLPAATRITYTMNGESHQFVVRHIFSDVTPDNPETAAGGA
ncbi:MAG: prepilin-type N-terminal cleavage/methylation domain-containing protein [Armatimonadetes bacterium]|nr:prepilin-type N-terminal cleavage/methylation domain-containing protein [Armatimonadota bacterium]